MSSKFIQSVGEVFLKMKYPWINICNFNWIFWSLEHSLYWVLTTNIKIRHDKMSITENKMMMYIFFKISVMFTKDWGIEHLHRAGWNIMKWSSEMLMLIEKWKMRTIVESYTKKDCFAHQNLISPWMRQGGKIFNIRQLTKLRVK